MMKSKRDNLKTGRRGENIAREYLRKKGYAIVEQNYKSRYAEIDLVARKKDTLVFVEVRTKIGERFGRPEETLSARKLEKVKRNAVAYAAYAGWKKAYRVDAICIVFKEDYTIERFNHYISV